MIRPRGRDVVLDSKTMRAKPRITRLPVPDGTGLEISRFAAE